MNYLIIYMSRHSTTEKVVGLLQEKLGVENCTLINLAKQTIPALEHYNTIIIGGSIHIGQIQKKLKEFCEAHQAILLKKRLGLFICFMNKELAQAQFETAFPDILRQHARSHGLFGGELLFDKMNFLERFIVKKIKKVNESVSDININAINQFAQTMANQSEKPHYN